MSKASKAGLLDLVVVSADGPETASTMDEMFLVEGNPYSIMETYFLDGVDLYSDSFEHICALSDKQS